MPLTRPLAAGSLLPSGCQTEKVSGTLRGRTGRAGRASHVRRMLKPAWTLVALQAKPGQALCTEGRTQPLRSRETWPLHCLLSLGAGAAGGPANVDLPSMPAKALGMQRIGNKTLQYGLARKQQHPCSGIQPAFLPSRIHCPTSHPP